jgi:HicA toxin of bacterial toxin-antitoxin,
MNSRQSKTLKAVFADPVLATIDWVAIEGLLVACGCRVIEGNGSRVRFEKDGMIETFHRPHPSKDAKKYQVRAARAYLLRLGIHQ